ncbi:hypothetical protein PSTG_06159 [Puccinia striiformis f. sp. tritici PST-78]|uniref:Uncharacterized protein n=1 Tax=Puccinia striiformis f. sp. tritici PST-78 TaxID=1165861 RepID=A0A0L0VNY2_9BASI|nr:hypothetical protein PSTG_06159 [Puccinia striiformis f. sp. tritici PST-78]
MVTNEGPLTWVGLVQRPPQNNNKNGKKIGDRLSGQHPNPRGESEKKLPPSVGQRSGGLLANSWVTFFQVPKDEHILCHDQAKIVRVVLVSSNASKTAFIPQLQPTRLGRIPQRTSLNPLDFLEFPDESESDDPNFDPLRNQESIDQLFKDSQQPFTFNPADSIGFDFSTLSNHPEPQQQQQQQPPNNNWNTAFDSLNAYNTFNQPILTDKLSPLTQGELAGVPFVNINLSESDASPEFIPPPTTCSSAAAAAEDLGSSSRL